MGPDLLIAGPDYPDMVDKYTPTLPGEGWYNFWTGLKVRKVGSRGDLLADSNASPDGTTLQSPAMKEAMDAIAASDIEPKIDQLPVFVRSGAILPMQPLVQSTDEVPNGPLELRIYPGSKCEGRLYLDDGHSFRYKDGDFLKIDYTCRQTSDGVTIQMGARQGHFAPWWKQVQVVVYGWNSPRATASVRGTTKTPQARVDSAMHTVSIVLPEDASATELALTAGP